jgi:hypothetical protein
MTGLEYVLIATFAAVWLVPLTMAVRWERRLKAAQQDLRHRLLARSPLDRLAAGRDAEARGR